MTFDIYIHPSPPPASGDRSATHQRRDFADPASALEWAQTHSAVGRVVSVFSEAFLGSFDRGQKQNP